MNLEFLYLVIPKLIREFKFFFLRISFQIRSFFYGYKVGKKSLVFGNVRFGSTGYGITIGDYCHIGASSFFSVSRGARINISNHVSFNTGFHIVAYDYISIGEGTAIGEYVSIRDQNHRFDLENINASNQGFSKKPIIIGKNVWVGRGCFIGSGVTIEDGAVIGANSVVVHDIPKNALAVGSPAKVVRIIEKH